ncbi:MAG: endonuclease domain-containing protein [Candidatus Latescibacterota bacterium]
MLTMPYLKNDPNLKSLRRSLRSSQTDAERYLWTRLRNNQIFDLRFFRQYSLGRFILDFYCPAIKLAIEIDGGQHAEKDHIEMDQKRTALLEEKGIRVLRFWNNDVLNEIESVMQKIYNEITPPNLSYIRRVKGRNCVRAK